MPIIRKTLDIARKLSILSQDSQYDLACACAPRDNEHRMRSKEGKWIYPVSLPQGGTTYLFKTLLSNHCVNNCKYCPLRTGNTTDRVTLLPEELVKTFLTYHDAGRVNGLFLSSGVINKPDITMEQINRVAILLRRSNFRGYIHLKIIPGSSDAAIRESVALANAVSLNVETAGVENFRLLSTTKDYTKDIVRPIELISSLIRENQGHRRVHQTTQFVVGASRETDKEILDHSWMLYKGLRLHRIYFSAYQRGLGVKDLPGENSCHDNNELLTREHRLYQVDWLFRKYGFRRDEIAYDGDGNLSLESDPKEMWAKLHPDFFPVNINRDVVLKLLRVPGLGHVVAQRILSFRQTGYKIRSFSDLGKVGLLLKKAQKYVTF